MVAELALTRRERESARPKRDNSGPGATEDRETMFEYEEEREIDNEYMTGDEYVEMEENKETEEYREYDQTMRFCSETDEMT
eukprot:3118944-Amphidinium_carterae.1